MRRRSYFSRPRARRSIAAVTTAASVSAFLAAVVLAPPAVAATSNPNPSAGPRRSATRLPFSISGTASVSVDVGTGNALFTDNLLTLPGVREDVGITLSYNSSVFGTATPSSVTGDTGSGWAISGFDQRVTSNSDGSVTYYGPGGLTGVFTPNGSGGYVTPSQFRADLTGSQSAGYTLTGHSTQDKLTFNSSGRLTKDTDRNSNVTTYNYDPYGNPSSIVSSRGPVAGRTASFTTSGGKITKITQTSGSLTRSVSLAYTSGGHLASVTDTVGGTTSFSATDEGASTAGPDTGEVKQITNPRGKSTYLVATSGQITKVSQFNPPIDGGAGESVTRLSYASATQTLVADPTTNQSQAVSAVPHTTYTINSSTKLVTSATDPNGHQVGRSYTGNSNVASTTPAAGGSTSFTYGKNSGESLTNVATPGGAAGSAQYNNTGGNAYLPSSSTDDAGNTLTNTYDTNGNQTGSAQGASGPAAKVTYNSNGTPATSASPGAATGVTTNYSYGNSDGDLTGITAPSNSSLGSRSYTWDGFGRLATATDGAGHTITYSYDGADRITKVQYSDGTHEVDYHYDANGHVTQRVDANGTTTYTFDDLGHLLTTSNSANGNTVTSTYDLAGALASSTDGLGVTSYSYDAAHQLTQMAYPQGGSTLYAEFANDSNGKRTDVWLQSNSGHTTWAAHEHFSYDNSGRISTVLGQNGPATGPTTVENETLCYAAGVAPTSCTSTPAAADRSNIQSTYESVSGETNTYTYDDHDRLTKDAVTGGSNPRTYTYGYDVSGNRTSSSVTGSSPTSQSLAYNDANQIKTSGYSYDGAGNLTTSPARTATFNAAGQQTSSTVAGTTSSYTYAGTNENEVLSEAIPNDHTYNLSYGRPDKNGLPEVDTVSVAGVGTGYVLSDPSGQPIMLSTSSGNTLLYLYDGIHNPIGLSTSFSTTAQAFRYDPYGGVTTTNNSGYASSYENPYTFGEGLLDRATHEVKFGRRFYNPTTGNWTQQDTLNAPLDPSNGNRYEYAADNPINVMDAMGRFSLSVSGCFAYVCAQVNVGTDSSGDLTGGGGIGLGTGEDGSGESIGATASGADIESGPYASAGCSVGNVEAGVSATESGASADVQASTTSSGECSGFVGYNG